MAAQAPDILDYTVPTPHVFYRTVHNFRSPQNVVFIFLSLFVAGLFVALIGGSEHPLFLLLIIPAFAGISGYAILGIIRNRTQIFEIREDGVQADSSWIDWPQIERIKLSLASFSPRGYVCIELRSVAGQLLATEYILRGNSTMSRRAYRSAVGPLRIFLASHQPHVKVEL